MNLVGSSPGGDDWHRILDASLAFLRSDFVPPIRVPLYAWNRFIDTGGTLQTWLALRPPPARDAVRITPIGDGESRRVVQMTPAADSNVIFVRRDGPAYVALIDARWSDDDPTRSQPE